MLHGLWRVFVVSGDMWCTGVMLLARGEFLFVVLVNEAMRDLWLCVPGCAAFGVWHVDDDKHWPRVIAGLLVWPDLLKRLSVVDGVPREGDHI